MRDFIAVTGIGRGHRAHALSPRFCLTDYFIYGHRVYIYIPAVVVMVVCAAPEHQRVRLQNYSPARRSGSIKTPGVRLLNRRPPPSHRGIRSYTGICMEKKKGNAKARR